MTFRLRALGRWSILTAAALAGALLISSAVGARAAGGAGFDCSGGSVPAGSYSSLTISGVCSVDAGNVTVAHNVSVEPGAALAAAFGGSDLIVGGNVRVGANGVLVLGCAPADFICFNDPDQDHPTLSVHDVIGGSLLAHDALAVLVHGVDIGGNVVMSGGGGGVNCDSLDVLQGAPAYGVIEDSAIGGNAMITNWHSCWLGFIRNTVGGNVNFHGNVTADPDGNEIVTNTIAGRLNCQGNSPAPQVGDSEGSPNIVARGASGQCTGLVAR